MAGSLQHDQAAQRIGIPPACAAKHRSNRPEADDALKNKVDKPMGHTKIIRGSGMIEEYKRALATLGASGNDLIDYIFKLCVVLLVDLAKWLGISYEELNVWLFVVIMPAIILLQFAYIIVLRHRLKALK